MTLQQVARMAAGLEDAVRAAQDHKALDVSLLDLTAASASFTDFFLICSGTSVRHTEAICDGIVERLKKSGLPPAHIEGYRRAEWILLDYHSFVVHIFVERARRFYDLDRLWKNARRVEVEE